MLLKGIHSLGSFFPVFFTGYFNSSHTVSSSVVFHDVSTLTFNWYSCPITSFGIKQYWARNKTNGFYIKIWRPSSVATLPIYKLILWLLFIGSVFPLACLRVFSPISSLTSIEDFFPVNYPIPLLFIQHALFQSLLCINTTLDILDTLTNKIDKGTCSVSESIVMGRRGQIIKNE